MNRKEILLKIGKLALKSVKIAEAMISGQFRSVFKGRGFEFEEVREYSLTDDSRLIDWNVTARSGTPYIKLYREQRELNLFILFDESASMDTGEGGRTLRELASETLALLVFACEKTGDRSGAAFFSRDLERWVKPSRGQKHAYALVENACSGKRGKRGSELVGAIEAVFRGLRKKTLIFILSDFMTTGWEEAAGRLAGRHDVVAVRFYAPLPSFSGFAAFPVADPETGFSVVLDFRFRHSFEPLAAFHEKNRKEWIIACARRGIERLEISVHDDPAEKLLAFFLRRRNS